MRRVVITGQGSVSPLGRSAAETMAAMREARSGIGPLEFPDVERLSIAFGGQIRGYAPEAADWWWEWLPRWAFFLLIAAFAVGVMVVLKRVRRAVAEGR